MHAHLGGGPHFHEVNKSVDQTGMATDTQGVELTKQHAHPVVGGVLKDDSDRTATGNEELPKFIQQRAADILADVEKSDINAHDYHFDDKGWVGGRPKMTDRQLGELLHPPTPEELARHQELGKEPVKNTAYPDVDHAAVAHETAAATAQFMEGLARDDSHDDDRPVPEDHKERVGKSIRDLLPLLNNDQEQFSAPYQIIRKAEGDNADELRMTMGVVYPVYDPERNAPGGDSPLDAHGDAATRDEVRKAAWRFSRNGLRASGLQHKGVGGAGDVVETWTFPDFLGKVVVKDVSGGEQTLVPGDWLATVVWSPEAWFDIKKGRYNGFSLQGLASRGPLSE